MAAVSALREEFGDEVNLTVVPPEVTNASMEEMARYNLGSRSHGLVAFDSSGEAVMSIAGHQFGDAEIRIAIAQATMN